MELRLEFTVEPFVEGRPGRHVRAAIDEARRLGLDPAVGPFATTVEGQSEVVLAALAAVTGAALEAGAVRVAMHVSPAAEQSAHPFLAAMEPVARALNAAIVGPGDLTPDDIPLAFDGDTVGGLRLPRASGMLDRLIAEVEHELGARLRDLSREDKQRAVKQLDKRGAFDLRRSTEDVADALGVSRITVYNYLNKL